MPPNGAPVNDARFVEKHAVEYCIFCDCEECDRFRDILEIEKGEEFDPENHNLALEEPDINGDCSVCGENEASFALNNGGKACEDCISEDRIGYCTNCEEFFFVANTGRFNEGVRAGADAVCPDCIESDNFDSFTCEECDELWPDNDTHAPTETRGGKIICVECLTQDAVECTKCEETIINRNFDGDFLGMDGGHVCQPCIEIHYEVCNNCGEIRDAEDLRGCRCPDDMILNYRFTPRNLQFYTAKTETGGKKRQDGRLYFGVEIEVECVEGEKERGSRYLSREPFWWCKRDASLDHGFEVVTHPFTWSWFLENKDIWVDHFKTLKEMGFLSFNTQTCGMHVHLDKGAFTRLHLYKFMKLIYDNKQFVIDISERNKDKLELYAGIDKENVSLPEKAKADSNFIPRETRRAQGDDEGHYVAVNLIKDSTVELRIFRGCLEEDRLMKNMEFVKALYEFSRITAIRNITVPVFCDWVEGRAHTYKNLHRFLENNGYC